MQGGRRVVSLSARLDPSASDFAQWRSMMRQAASVSAIARI